MLHRGPIDSMAEHAFQPFAGLGPAVRLGFRHVLKSSGFASCHDALRG